MLDLTDAHPVEGEQEIQTPQTMAFVKALHTHFAGRPDELLANAETLTDTGEQVTRELVKGLLGEENERLRGEVSAERFEQYYRPASALISDLCLDETFVGFLTLPAYEHII